MATISAEVRQVMETDAGYDTGLWKQLADMGVAGLVIKEAFGGAGAGPVELERVMEEARAALLCTPLLASGVFFCPMKQSGVEVRPLRQITNESHFNEVFLTDVIIPEENLLGDLNGGWGVL